jgi:hypothetical protein
MLSGTSIMNLPAPNGGGSWPAGSGAAASGRTAFRESRQYPCGIALDVRDAAGERSTRRGTVVPLLVILFTERGDRIR